LLCENSFTIKHPNIMNCKKIMKLLGIMLLVIAFSPAYAQNDPPSKFEMKKDADGDGVKNKRDKCPATPRGVFVDGTGCPLDTDKDGVPDYLDNCPTVPGSADMNGCQDKDKDGVSDFVDVCPDVPGSARFKGCPDSDGDGIEDSKDQCPNAKGSDLFHGCPDTDGDGIVDANDKCPGTEKGIKVDSRGCATDNDGDGVIDSDDKCPGTGTGIKVDGSGCPVDSDGDGVLDSDDKCPGIVGDASNNGCPTAKKETPKRLQFAARRINFDTKNALLKTSSYPMLDEVANIVNEYPDYNVRIGGHTDGIEKDPMTLSESRGDVVKSYLLSKGVSQSRIVMEGYGKTRPMATNVNASGRAQNRRVVLELYLR
jgi:outer membrane protein OmpA-like peptidoglycan-associated protein